MMSLEFSISKATMEPPKLLRRPAGEKYQPICGPSVICVTDDFVVCRQAERVKVFFLPPHPRRILPGGVFYVFIKSLVKGQGRLVRRKIESLD